MADEPVSPTIETPEPQQEPDLSPVSLLYPSEEESKPVEAEAPAIEATPEDTPKGEAKDKPTEAKADEGENEEEGAEVSSVSELAEHIEVEPEWFDTLDVSVKVDGQESTVKLKDLKDNYQIREAADKRLSDAKSKSKAQNQELSDRAAALESQYVVAATLVQNAENLYAQDIKEMEKLRADDPAEYSARMIEFDARKKTLESAKTEIANAYTAAVQQKQAENEVGKAELFKSENAKLIEKLPEWADNEKAQVGKTRLSEYLLSTDFTREELAEVYDHRLFVMAEKARLYDEVQIKSQAAKKKVTKIPKILKPGPASDPAPKPGKDDAVSILYG